MMKITDTQAVTYAKVREGNSQVVKLASEASSLGFAAGRWPQAFEYCGQIFTVERGERRENKLVAVHYKGDKGARFVVFND